MINLSYRKPIASLVLEFLNHLRLCTTHSNSENFQKMADMISTTASTELKDVVSRVLARRSEKVSVVDTLQKVRFFTLSQLKLYIIGK